MPLEGFKVGFDALFFVRLVLTSLLGQWLDQYDQAPILLDPCARQGEDSVDS